MLTRLSASAQRVLRAAEQECRNRNQYYIGVEHVLLALLDDEDQEVLARLSARGNSRRELHRQLRSALGVGEERGLWDGILITPRAHQAFDEAERAAGEGEVRPAHLFDAVAAAGGLPAELLAPRATSPASRS